MRELESQIQIKREPNDLAKSPGPRDSHVDSLERFMRKLETIPVLTHEQQTNTAKTFSTLEFVNLLLQDISGQNPDTTRTLTPAGKDQKNPILAKEVADALLEDVGLTGNIELRLHEEENLKTKNPLSDKEKVERKAVIGYTWRNEVDEQHKENLTFKLKKRIEKAKDAQQMLIEHNLRWGKTLAQRSTHKHLPVDDRIQASFLGVMKAAQKFDWRTDNTFATYATWWINKEIQDTSYKESRTIRLPKNAEQAIAKVKKTIEIFTREHGATPSTETVKQIITKETSDITQPMIDQAVTLLATNAINTLSLHEITSDNTDGQEGKPDLSLVLKDKKANTEQAALASLDKQNLDTAINQLSEREKIIIFLRYEEGMTYAEIGEKLGLSSTRINQIDTKIRKKLKENPLLAEYMAEM